jgi:Cu2+-exporting ATPase
LSAARDICFHCGALIPTGLIIEEQRDGETLRFCCKGCLGAYLLITGAGLASFYSRRDWQEPGLIPDAYKAVFDDAALAAFVRQSGDTATVDILIDGIRCASCVWLNEKFISRLHGVHGVRVNYATNRAHVSFDPAVITPAQLFSQISELGYTPRPFSRSEAEQSASREQRDLLIRFGTAFFLTMQLMAYSFGLYAGYFQGIDDDIKYILQFFSMLVSAPVIFYSGWPFLSGAWRGLKNSAPTMDLLIVIGALSSFCYSIYATFTGGEVYYETAAMIVTLILAGRLMENHAKRRACSGTERLLSLTAGTAVRLTGNQQEQVAIVDIRIGDILLVGAGERFPVDGRIVAGSTDVDESPATGEPLPVLKQTEDSLIAGSINLTGTVHMVCDHPAADSFVARVARLVEEAQSRRAPIQGLADRIAALFVPIVLLLGTATFVWQYYLLSIRFDEALMTALAVILIACPCALGLATPTAIVAGTGAAAAAGVIFKGGDILEQLSRISVALFDKTGTITCGVPKVESVIPQAGMDFQKLAGYAAAVESGSLHPVGKAICLYAEQNGADQQLGTELRTVAGGGVLGTVDGIPVVVGNARFLQEQGVPDLPVHDSAAPGSTIVYLAIGGRCAGTFFLTDRLRDESGTVLASFRKQGIRSMLLSGDRAETVQYIANILAVEQGIGDMTPDAKTCFIEELRAKGEQTLMVGDGINDAPALSAADVGCALVGGTDIAIETSDLILVKPDLNRLLTAYLVARRTMAVIRQNLGWAFIYNLIGIPLAMAGLLTPIYAAAAMALSSLCVVGNSLRLTVNRHG